MNSDQENTAENQMAKALGGLLGCGALIAVIVIGLIVLIVKAL